MMGWTSVSLLAATLVITGAKPLGFLDWLHELTIPVLAFYQTDDGGTKIWKYDISSIQLPTLQSAQNDSTVHLVIHDLGMRSWINKLENTRSGNRWFDWMRGWTGDSVVTMTDVSFRLEGSLYASITADFDYQLIHFHSCQSTVQVVGDIDGELNGGVLTWAFKEKFKTEVKKGIRDAFAEKVCGVDGLTRDSQRKIDEFIKLSHEREDRNENESEATPPLQTPAVQWKQTAIYKWLEVFSDHSEENGFSWDAFLQPVVGESMANSSNCLLGDRPGYACLAPGPQGFTKSLGFDAPDSPEKEITIRLQNFALLLNEFNVDTAPVPTGSENSTDWMGINFAFGRISLRFICDLELRAHNLGQTHESLRKTLSLDFGIDNFAVRAFFLLEIANSKYQALTELQRASPPCLDSITNRFELEALSMDLVLQNFSFDIQSEQGVTKAEVEWVRSLQELLNMLVVSAMNINGEKINDLVEAVAKPGIAMALRPGGIGLNGMLQKIGLGLWGDRCVSDSDELVGRLKALTMSLLLGTCILWFMLKACSNQQAAAERSEAAKRRLITQESTGLHWALALPLLIVASTLLLIMANTMPAATVRLHLLSDGGLPIAIKDIKEFSVVESVVDLWNLGAKVLAVCIFVFSLVFPYVKLLTCTALLFLKMTDQRRGCIVHLIDGFGKASLLDVFVLMFVKTFTSLEVHFRGNIGAAVYVILEWGYLAFVMGTMLAMVVGHLVLMLHYRVKTEDGGKSRKGSPRRDSRLVSESPPLCFLPIFLITVMLLFIGSFLTFSVLEVDGLVGWFLNFVQHLNQQVTGDASAGNIFHFSIVALGAALGKGDGKEPAVTAAIQATYYMFSIVLALLFLVVCILLCFRMLNGWKRLSRDSVVRLNMVGHTLMAWGAVDVFAVSGIVTMVEMKGASIVPTNPFMRNLIGRMRSIGKLSIPGEEDVIVTLWPQFGAGAYMICAGAGMFLVFGYWFMHRVGRFSIQPSALELQLPTTRSEVDTEFLR